MPEAQAAELFRRLVQRRRDAAERAGTRGGAGLPPAAEAAGGAGAGPRQRARYPAGYRTPEGGAA
ncbi:hypothetical protein [Pseudorhodoferax sp.]|uniref:hypothetical protein n=1 Tax=Pseudorhodoferax sp. TaxID=1993553 RepID=UPI0039E23794